MALFFECLYYSGIATFQIIYITLFGILFKYLKIVDKKFEDSLSKLILNIILPSFIFCEVIENFDKDNVMLLVRITVGLLTINVIGIIVGFIYSLFIKSNSSERNFYLAIMSSPNVTSVTMVILEVLSPILDKFKYDDDTPLGKKSAKERGLLYISLLSILANIWRWTFTFNFINNKNKTEILLDPSINVADKRTIRKTIKEILNVPIITSILALVISLIEYVKDIFIDKDSFLKATFFDSHQVISKCYTFTVIFLLGLNISNILPFKMNEPETIETNTEKKKISIWKIIFVSILKLVIVPLIGTPIIVYFLNIGFILDKVLVFLLFFTLAAPISINILVICNAKKAWVEYISLIMLANYVICIFSITISNAIFLNILS
jgi:predicted permease